MRGAAIDAAVVVRPRGARDGAMRRGGKSVTHGQLPQLDGADCLGQIPCQPVLFFRTGAVYELPQAEEHEPFLHLVPVQRPRHRVNGMGQRVDYAFLPQVIDQPVDVVPARLGLAVYARVEPVDEDIRVVFVLREAG